jgi:hypothetical protein
MSRKLNLRRVKAHEQARDAKTRAKFEREMNLYVARHGTREQREIALKRLVSAA